MATCRVHPRLHAAIAAYARRHRTTMNDVMVAALTEKIERETTTDVGESRYVANIAIRDDEGVVIGHI